MSRSAVSSYSFRIRPADHELAPGRIEAGEDRARGTGHRLGRGGQLKARDRRLQIAERFVEEDRGARERGPVEGHREIEDVVLGDLECRINWCPQLIVESSFADLI